MYVLLHTVYNCHHLHIYTAPTPRVFINQSYSQQGVIGEELGLICSIVVSSTAQTSSLILTWNFTSNDDRVTVIPTTITTDNSIGIIYTTVIQFAYLIEGDERNYTCVVIIDEDSAESTFNLEITSKCKLKTNMYICSYTHCFVTDTIKCIVQNCDISNSVLQNTFCLIAN